MQFENVVVAGIGETEYHKDPADHRQPMEYVRDAIDLALEDSGFSKDDIDGFSATSYQMGHMNEVELAFHLGICGRWTLGDNLGNASPAGGLIRGAKAIENGKAETVLVVAGDAYSVQRNVDVMGKWHFLSNYMYPYGLGGANSHFSFIQRRHMHEYGTTREQLSNISVTQRENATGNPNAIFQDPLTKEEYLNARPIVEPVHLYDCVYPCGGGNAVILTTEERAESLDTQNVYIRGGEEYHNPNPRNLFALSSPLKNCTNVFDDAGVSRDQLDAVELYDNYPIWVTIQLEDLGFCDKGDGGKFIEETDLSTTGDLPLNTGGGQLSMGQAGGAGGLVHSVEAIRQLRGEGGNRQVPECGVALAGGYGNVTYGGGLSGGASIFSRTSHQEGAQ